MGSRLILHTKNETSVGFPKDKGKSLTCEFVFPESSNSTVSTKWKKCIF